MSSNNSARLSAKSYHSDDSRGPEHIHRKVLKENHTDILRQRFNEEKKRDPIEIALESVTLKKRYKLEKRVKE